MLLIVTAYILVMPALLRLAENRGWRAKERVSSEAALFYTKIDSWKRPALIAVTLACVGLGFAIPNITFDYDFQSLQGGHQLRSVILNSKVSKILGHSQSPLLLITDTGAEDWLSPTISEIGNVRLAKLPP